MNKQTQEVYDESISFYERQRDRSVGSISKKSRKQKASTLAGYMKGHHSASKIVNIKPKESNLDFIKNENFNIKYKQTRQSHLIPPPTPPVQKYKSDIQLKEEYNQKEEIKEKINEDKSIQDNLDNLANNEIPKNISVPQINNDNLVNNNQSVQNNEIKIKQVVEQRPPQIKNEIIKINSIQQSIQIKPVKIQPKFQSAPQPQIDPKKSKISNPYQPIETINYNHIQNTEVIHEYLNRQSNLQYSRPSLTQNLHPFLRSDRESLIIGTNLQKQSFHKKQQQQSKTPKYNNAELIQSVIPISKESFQIPEKRVRTSKIFKANRNSQNKSPLKNLPPLNSIRQESKNQNYPKKQQQQTLKKVDEINHRQGRHLIFNLKKNVSYDDVSINEGGCFGNTISNFCV